MLHGSRGERAGRGGAGARVGARGGVHGGCPGAGPKVRGVWDGCGRARRRAERGARAADRELPGVRGGGTGYQRGASEAFTPHRAAASTADSGSITDAQASVLPKTTHGQPKPFRLRVRAVAGLRRGDGVRELGQGRAGICGRDAGGRRRRLVVLVCRRAARFTGARRDGRAGAFETRLPDVTFTDHLLSEPSPPLCAQPPTEAVAEPTAADADEAVCYLRGVHMSPYKVRAATEPSPLQRSHCASAPYPGATWQTSPLLRVGPGAGYNSQATPAFRYAEFPFYSHTTDTMGGIDSGGGRRWGAGTGPADGCQACLPCAECLVSLVCGNGSRVELLMWALTGYGAALDPDFPSTALPFYSGTPSTRYSTPTDVYISFSFASHRCGGCWM